MFDLDNLYDNFFLGPPRQVKTIPECIFFFNSFSYLLKKAIDPIVSGLIRK